MLETTRTFTRRGAIKLGGGVGLGLVAGAGVFTSSSRAASRIWSRASYLPLVGKSFTVRGHRTPLQLVTVDDLPARAAGSDDAFALVFRAPSGGAPLPAGLPELNHPALGSFSMFLVSGRRSQSGTPLVAVIDRTHG